MRHVVLDLLSLRRRQMQSDLASAPQDILGSARPLVPAQVLDFGRREALTEILPQILSPSTAPIRVP